MTDMSMTILAKSDQLNSSDLISGPITVKINKVSLVSGEQPVAVHYDGDDGKPWKPCKSMRRVLVRIWGKDSSKWIGKSLTLYLDDKVIYGGVAVGGTRISHMSDITEPVTMALTATRSSKKPYTVQPLKVAASSKPAPVEKTAATKKTEFKDAAWIDWGKAFTARLEAATSHAEVEDMEESSGDDLTAMQTEAPKIYTRIMERIASRRAELSAAVDDSDDLPDFA